MKSNIQSIRHECRRIMDLPQVGRLVGRRKVLEGIRVGDIGAVLFRDLGADGRDAAADAGISGWPECECTGCGCSEPATCTDDQSVATCWKCQDYRKCQDYTHDETVHVDVMT